MKDVILLTISAKVEISRNFVISKVKVVVVKMEKLLRHVRLITSQVNACITDQLSVQIVKILNQELNASNGPKMVKMELNACNINVVQMTHTLMLFMVEKLSDAIHLLKKLI